MCARLQAGAHQGQRWAAYQVASRGYSHLPTVTLWPSRAFGWVVGERTGDEMRFVARSDGRAIWSYELTVSR